MQFEYLKVFCDVARKRSFSQAAQANDITQSAVSQIVSQLEKRLDAQLVDRSVRPLRLTTSGQTFYEGCKDLLQQYTDLQESVRCARSQVAGDVRVAAIYSVGLGDMTPFVQRLTSLQPKIRVHLDYLHPDAVYERVLDGAVDLGLVSFPRKSPKLTTLSWRDEDMVLACDPKDPLARNRAIRPEEIEGRKYVHFARNLAIRRKVDRFLRQQHVTVDVALEFDNIENIKQAVALGAGVALLPEPTLRREVTAGTLVALPLLGASLIRPLGIIHRRRHHLSAAARLLVDLLVEGTDSPSLSAGPIHGSSIPSNGEPAHGSNGKSRTAKKVASS